VNTKVALLVGCLVGSLINAAMANAPFPSAEWAVYLTGAVLAWRQHGREPEAP
jgi:hypothetical protein